MTDMMAVLNSLVDVNGKILIPGIEDSVAKLTEEEKKLYEPIDFSPVSKLLTCSHLFSVFYGLKQFQEPLWWPSG